MYGRDSDHFFFELIDHTRAPLVSFLVRHEAAYNSIISPPRNWLIRTQDLKHVPSLFT